ncbi:MAG: aspartate carbamoyltransferase [Negativicutes bacterium]|nr:aspartate carbamoyltransferase [Negativicutes bacterium]
MLKGRHLIEPHDFTPAEMEEIFRLAETMAASMGDFFSLCRGMIMATLFYEPSTRTRFSFEAAMYRLGGQVIGFAEPNSSSVAKGESIADTIRTVACYADIAVMRHPKEGSALVAAGYSPIPVINAGDGGHHHPTQTLTDLFTIRHYKQRFEGLTVGLCGDLKFGRTVHSLIQAMARYPGVRFVCVSPGELTVPDYIMAGLPAGCAVECVVDQPLEQHIGKMDILYMTRVQRERFFNEADYLRLKDCYILDRRVLSRAREDLIVMHPLPRVNEIAYGVDDDRRAVYFPQARLGMIARMALIAKLLGVS